MQKRLLGFLQQVGLFIKLFKVIDSTERCKIRLRNLCMKITHGYNVFIRFRVKFSGFSQLFGMILNLLLGLKKTKDLFLRRFNSIQNASKPTEKEYRSKGKVTMASLTNNIISPPLSFRSNLYTVVYP